MSPGEVKYRVFDP